MHIPSLLQYLEDLSVCGWAPHTNELKLPDEGGLREAGGCACDVLHCCDAAL